MKMQNIVMYIKELYIRITKVKVDFGIGTEAELLCNTSKNWKLTFFMKKSMSALFL